MSSQKMALVFSCVDQHIESEKENIAWSMKYTMYFSVCLTPCLK